jgi:hypothetical protein
MPVALAVAQAPTATHAPPRLDTGTAIVIFASPQEVVAAADSMLGSHGFNEGSVVFTECKIRRVGDVFFALAGTVRERPAPYDAAILAEKGLRLTGGNLFDKVTEFERTAMAELPDVVRRARDFAPEFYERRLKNRVILQAAFFGVHEGATFLYVRDFESEVSGNGRIVVKSSGGSCTGDCDMLAILGDGTASKKYLAATPPKAASAVDLVQKLIALEMENRSNETGPPVDIVRIDAKGGAIWIQKKPGCVE